MRRRGRALGNGGPELDTSSLIDVSFLLLVYFLVTSTLDPREADLGMTMPTTGRTHEAPVIDHMFVRVNDAGHVLLENEVLDTDAHSRDVPLLLDRLRTYAESARLIGSEPTVILSAADGADGQRFVDVLNALADPGVAIHKVSLRDFGGE